MEELLQQVDEKKPQYKAEAAALSAYSKSLPEGPCWLSYGGLTVANNPMGRDLDVTDEDDAYGFFKQFRQCYEEAEGEIDL